MILVSCILVVLVCLAAVLSGSPRASAVRTRFASVVTTGRLSPGVSGMLCERCCTRRRLPYRRTSAAPETPPFALHRIR